MEYILKTFNRPDFAKQVNNLVVKYLETYKPNNPFKDLYFSLLPKYQENILDDLIKVLASPLEKSMLLSSLCD